MKLTRRDLLRTALTAGAVSLVPFSFLKRLIDDGRPDVVFVVLSSNGDEVSRVPGRFMKVELGYRVEPIHRLTMTEDQTLQVVMAADSVPLFTPSKNTRLTSISSITHYPVPNRFVAAASEGWRPR